MSSGMTPSVSPGTEGTASRRAQARGFLAIAYSSWVGEIRWHSRVIRLPDDQDNANQLDGGDFTPYTRHVNVRRGLRMR